MDSPEHQQWTRLYLDIPPEVKQQLKIKAAQEGLTVKALAEKIFNDALKPKEAKKHETRKGK